MFVHFEKDNMTIYFVKNANDGKNEVTFIKDNRFYGKIPNVNKDLGNYWFKYAKRAKENNSDGEKVADQIFFDSFAFNDDYDSYSDFYKEVYNVRPHYSREAWETIVKYVRENKKP